MSKHETVNQWGFTKGVSFLQCSVVRETLSKLSIEKKIPLYCTAADVQSAFSRTNRVCQLFECQLQREYGKLFLFKVGFNTNTDVISTANNMLSEKSQNGKAAVKGASAHQARGGSTLCPLVRW